MKPRNLLLLFVLSCLNGTAMAQWGNRDHQEKADVLGRDLAGISGLLNEHDGIFWKYTTGDPDDKNNSILIEMLGSSVTTSPVCLSTGISTCSLQSFVNAAQFLGLTSYRGAFRSRQKVMTRIERVGVEDMMVAMENRPSQILYISTNNFQVPRLYLDWTDRNSNGQLDFDDIDRMRSDAFVEYPYAFNGVPIARVGLQRTIITDPNDFRYMASLLLLLPSSQLYWMNVATIDNPVVTVRDANGATLAPGAASSMTAISVFVSDQLSGPGRLELWSGTVQTGSLIAVNNDDVPSTSHTYTSADTGLSTMSNLANGQYTIRAIDQAGNYSSGEFRVWTGTGPSSGENSRTASVPASQTSTDCYTAVTTDTIAGIDSIVFSKDGGGYSEFANFQCASVAKFGPFCNLAAGSYTTRIQNCAGTQWTYASTVTAASNSVQICGTDPSNQTTCNSTTLSAAQLVGTSSITVKTTGGGFPLSEKGKMCLGIATSAFGIEELEEAGCEIYDGSNNNIKREFEGPASWWAGTTTFRVWNNNPGSTQAINIGLNITVDFFDLNGNRASTGLQYILGGSPDYYADPGEGIDGTVSVSEVGQPYPIADASQVFKAMTSPQSLEHCRGKCSGVLPL